MKNSLFSIFEQYPDLVIALSEKRDGSMRLSGNLMRDKAIIENRIKFLDKLGIDYRQLVRASLVHGSNVAVVSKKDAGQRIAKTDGLLTEDKNLFLSITVADCLPIFLCDFKQEIVGLIHGGWRSLAQNILSSAIKKLADEFNSQPGNILVGIGPGIAQCHFEVGEDVLVRFQPLLPPLPNNRCGGKPEAMVKRGQKTFLDLKKIAEIQLINLGLKKENIEINPDCTYCIAEQYFSYRRDRPPLPKNRCGGEPEVLETMLAVIGVKVKGPVS